MTDYPELPDFLNRKLHPELRAASQIPATRAYKALQQIVWPAKRIDQVMKAKARKAKQARKAKAKAKRAEKWRG